MSALTPGERRLLSRGFEQGAEWAFRMMRGNPSILERMLIRDHDPYAATTTGFGERRPEPRVDALSPVLNVLDHIPMDHREPGGYEPTVLDMTVRLVALSCLDPFGRFALDADAVEHLSLPTCDHGVPCDAVDWRLQKAADYLRVTRR